MGAHVCVCSQDVYKYSVNSPLESLWFTCSRWLLTGLPSVALSAPPGVLSQASNAHPDTARCSLRWCYERPAPREIPRLCVLSQKQRDLRFKTHQRSETGREDHGSCVSWLGGTSSASVSPQSSESVELWLYSFLWSKD